MKTLLNSILCAGSMLIAISVMAQFSTASPVESVIQFGGSQVGAVEAAVNEAGELGNLGDMVGSTGTALGHLGTMFGVASDAAELYSASQTLDRNECVPDFTTDARAMMPSSCGSQPSCEQCYSSAINNLNTIRRSLGRLSCIYSNTKIFYRKCNCIWR